MVASYDKDDINDRNTSAHEVLMLTILKQSSFNTGSSKRGLGLIVTVNAIAHPPRLLGRIWD